MNPSYNLNLSIPTVFLKQYCSKKNKKSNLNKNFLPNTRDIKLDQNANANQSDVIEKRLPNFEVVTEPYAAMAMLERPISATVVRRMSVAAATAAAEVMLGSRRVVRLDDDKEDEVLLVHRPYDGTPSAGIVCAPGRDHNY